MIKKQRPQESAPCRWMEKLGIFLKLKLFSPVRDIKVTA
jgi:hypothetical protein